MKPARIAFIGQRGVPATVGGIEHHVEEIGARLAARGHEVTVYTRASYATDRRAEHRGMRVRYLPAPPSKRLETLVHSGLSTSAAMVGPQAADILHFHAIGPSVFTPLPRLLSRRGVVLTVHGLDYERDKWGTGARAALRTAGWMSAHVPHATITVSRNLADFYATRYGRHADYITNGITPPAPRPPAEITERWGLRGRDYVLFLGRLVPEKAPELLMRAFRAVPGDVRLVVAGGSSYTDDYVATLHRLAAADPRIVMAGPVYGTTRDELYTNAAAFVLPSRLEGLPLTLLEAASYALPLVASDIPPHREVLGASGPGGRLVSHDEAMLARTLTTVLEDNAAERDGARELAERVVAEHDWDRVADATEAVYERVLARATSPSGTRSWRGRNPPPRG